MSVTFAIESNPTGRFVISPACVESIGAAVTFGGADATEADGTASYSTYERALADIVEHKNACDDCAHYGCYSQAIFDAPNHLDVRLTQRDAGIVLTCLGLIEEGHEWVGTISAGDLALRLSLLQVSIDTEFGLADNGTVSAQISTPGQATVIDCATAPGFYASTISRLLALVDEATRLGRDITWV